MDRRATAEWSGGLQDGKGSFSSESGAFKNIPYTFKTRFGGVPGTNPEELIAAAHSSCFTMALTNELEKRGMKPEKLETTATVTVDKVGDGFEITKSYLNVKAKIPGGDQAKFDEAVKTAEKGCPVSKLMKAEIKVTSKLN